MLEQLHALQVPAHVPVLFPHVRILAVRKPHPSVGDRSCRLGGWQRDVADARQGILNAARFLAPVTSGPGRHMKVSVAIRCPRPTIRQVLRVLESKACIGWPGCHLALLGWDGLLLVQRREPERVLQEILVVRAYPFGAFRPTRRRCRSCCVATHRSLRRAVRAHDVAAEHARMRDLLVTPDTDPVVLDALGAQCVDEVLLVNVVQAPQLRTQHARVSYPDCGRVRSTRAFRALRCGRLRLLVCEKPLRPQGAAPERWTVGARPAGFGGGEGSLSRS